MCYKTCGYLLAVALLEAATRAGACEVTVSPVEFGIYSGTATQARGEVIVQGCASFRIALNRGLSGNSHTRRLSDGRGNQLIYNLYQDAGHRLVWGDGGSGGEVAGGRQAGRFVVYGLVPGGQFPLPGEYADQVMVTVEW